MVSQGTLASGDGPSVLPESVSLRLSWFERGLSVRKRVARRPSDPPTSPRGAACGKLASALTPHDLSIANLLSAAIASARPVTARPASGRHALRPPRSRRDSSHAGVPARVMPPRLYRVLHAVSERDDTDRAVCVDSRVGRCLPGDEGNERPCDFRPTDALGALEDCCPGTESAATPIVFL